MGAAVVERADFSLAVAHDDERTQTQAPGDEIVHVGDFAFVREIGPGAAEDVRHLGFEDRRIGVDQPVRAILLDQIIPVVERGAAERGSATAPIFSSAVMLPALGVSPHDDATLKEIEILILLPLARLVARRRAALFQRTLDSGRLRSLQLDEIVDKGIAERAAEQRLLLERIERLGQALRQQRPFGGVRFVACRRQCRVWSRCRRAR